MENRGICASAQARGLLFEIDQFRVYLNKQKAFPFARVPNECLFTP